MGLAINTARSVQAVPALGASIVAVWRRLRRWFRYIRQWRISLGSSLARSTTRGKKEATTMPAAFLASLRERSEPFVAFTLNGDRETRGVGRELLFAAEAINKVHVDHCATSLP
ncbi:hypothetical protein MRX96_031843 [Rhipicephalus microplus]